jgi:hypothetical protein
VAVRLQSVSLQPLDCWDRGFGSRCSLDVRLLFVVVYVGLCDELVTHLEETYLARARACDLETSKRGGLGRPWAVAPLQKKEDFSGITGPHVIKVGSICVADFLYLALSRCQNHIQLEVVANSYETFS